MGVLPGDYPARARFIPLLYKRRLHLMDILDLGGENSDCNLQGQQSRL